MSHVEISSQLWHTILGHFWKYRMNHLPRGGLLGRLSNTSIPTYKKCLIVWETRFPFGKAFDICELINVSVRRGALYFITCINDYTRFDILYLMSHKWEALRFLKKLKNLVENKLGKIIKPLRTHCGCEYLLDEFKELCEDIGIARQLIILHTPQQNGEYKIHNRILVDMVRSMIAHANLIIS